MGARGFTPSVLEVALYEIVLLAMPDDVELDWAEQHDPERKELFAVVFFDPPAPTTVQPAQYIRVTGEEDDVVEEIIEQVSEVTGYVEFRGDGAYQAAQTFRLSRSRSRVRSACLAKGMGWNETEPPQRLPQALQKGARDRVRAGVRFEVLETATWTTNDWVRESTLVLEDDTESVTLPQIAQTYT